MTTLKEWFSAAELAGKPGMPGTERGARKMAERENWKSRKRERGKGFEYYISALPPATQAALHKQHRLQHPVVGASLSATVLGSEPVSPSGSEHFSSYDRAAVWAQFERKPEKQRAIARERLAALDAAAALITHGVPRLRAFAEAATAHQCSTSSLERWYRDVRPHPRCDWLALLVPGYVGRTAIAECSPEAWDYFKADFLRLEKPAAAACYERLQRAAQVHGWNVPALRTLERRLEREIPRAVQILAREGAEALKRAFPAQERDHSVFHALEAVNADGHKFDVFARWPDGTIARPVMVAWQDIYSGKFLGYRVDHSEHSGLVRLSFGDMVERYGIPSHTYLDNGRSFAAKFLTGGTATRYRFKVREDDPLGILTHLLGKENVHWATPYHGQAKPIERAFRDLCEYVAKHPAFAGAYTGNKPDAKPENYASRAVPLEEFLLILDQEITAHNARTGRRSKVCAGRSFDEAFAESYARAPIRKATDAQRRLWLLAADGVTASRQDGSITLFGNRYWSEAQGQYAGQKLIARFDPDRLQTAVEVETLDGRYIGRAECVHAAGFNSESAARDQARARNQWKRAARAQLDAERRMNAAQAAALLPAPEPTEPPESKVVRPVFERRVAGSDVHPEAEVIDITRTQRRDDAEREMAVRITVDEDLAWIRANVIDER